MPVRILLADDHRIFTEALVALLTAEPDFEVVGVADSGEEAVVLAEAERPDVVVMDVALPDFSGMEAARRIASAVPAVRIVALSAFEERGFVEGMFESGAAGYLRKRCAREELVAAIRQVHAGKRYGGPGAAKPPARTPSRGRKPKAAPALTGREREVLRLISDGNQNTQIAALLGLSEHTVVRHRQRIMDKLDLRCVADLTRFAVREHITTL